MQGANETFVDFVFFDVIQRKKESFVDFVFFDVIANARSK